MDKNPMPEGFRTFRLKEVSAMANRTGRCGYGSIIHKVSLI